MDLDSELAKLNRQMAEVHEAMAAMGAGPSSDVTRRLSAVESDNIALRGRVEQLEGRVYEHDHIENKADAPARAATG